MSGDAIEPQGPRFTEGDRVVLLRSIYGLAENSGIEDVTVPVGTIGDVLGVRGVGDPRNREYQGPWLYDVFFPVTVTLPADYERDEDDPPKWVPGATVQDVVWAIYDATDVRDLIPALSVQPTAPEGGGA
jgi:hypothetical protein